MVEKRPVGSEKSSQELFDSLNRIFEDYEIAFGGIRVGDVKGDGSKATWIDVFGCYKEDLRTVDRFGDFDRVTDRGFLMLMVQASDQLTPDLRTRVVILFDDLNSRD